MGYIGCSYQNKKVCYVSYKREVSWDILLPQSLKGFKITTMTYFCVSKIVNQEEVLIIIIVIIITIIIIILPGVQSPDSVYSMLL